MRQFVRAAAFAAMLLFVPFSAPSYATPQAVGGRVHMTLPASGAPLEEVSQAPAFAPAAPRSGPRLRLRVPHSSTAARADLAPGQSKADYYAWLARNPAHRMEVQAFRDHLAAEGLEDIVPVWQLIRTSSSWRACNADRFEVAPRDKWEHITTTLRFVRDEVVPVLGEVEALSAYRNEALNRCSAGAPESAHRLFFALDLTPVNPDVNRGAMIRQICAAHARDGRGYNTGLGFYTGMRFHVDSNGFRRWGADGRGATSPCASGNYA
jgi:hypothetical protein